MLSFATNPTTLSLYSTAENLALACADCNRYKGPNLSSVDPDSNQLAPLFHPRRDRWSDHFALDGLRIVGRTPVGRATVFLLQFNTDERVLVRKRLLREGGYRIEA